MPLLSFLSLLLSLLRCCLLSSCGAGTCVGIQVQDAIVLVGERKSTSKLLAPVKTSEKTYKLDEHVSCLVAGLTADANTLITQARLAAQRYRYTYQEPMPVEQLVQRVCNYKHAYTQYGGLRPFGVAFLFAGYDEHFGFQLYQSDPSGNYSGWQATVIGQNNQAGKSLLKTEYKPDMTLEQGLELAAKVLLKTMDTTTPSPEKTEFSVLQRIDGATVHRVLREHEVQQILDRVVEQQQQEQAQQAAAAATQGDV